MPAVSQRQRHLVPSFGGAGPSRQQQQQQSSSSNATQTRCRSLDNGRISGSTATASLEGPARSPEAAAGADRTWARGRLVQQRQTQQQQQQQQLDDQQEFGHQPRQQQAAARYKRLPPLGTGDERDPQQQQQQQQQQPFPGSGQRAPAWLQQPLPPWGPQQQQQPWQGGEDEDVVYPSPPAQVTRYVRSHRGAWYQQQRYMAPAALHAAILERCGHGSYEPEALLHLVRTAGGPRDAQLALSALAAVRGVAVSQGRMAPWPDTLVKAFVKMTAACDAHGVLISAMQRPNELGLVFKWKSLLVALKIWGDALAVDQLEAVAGVMEDAGLRPDPRMAYVLVRAAVNARQYERVPGMLAWFRARGVTEFKPAMQPLLDKVAAALAAADDAGGRE